MEVRSGGRNHRCVRRLRASPKITGITGVIMMILVVVVVVVAVVVVCIGFMVKIGWVGFIVLL